MFKKISAICALCAATLLTTPATFAGNMKDFQMLLFNSTGLDQPLHYTITHNGMELSEGMLGKDGHTGSVSISDFGSGKEIEAEVIVTDNASNVIWDSMVTFFPTDSTFFTKAIALD